MLAERRSASGDFVTQFGEAQITKIGAIAARPEGYVYVADWGQHKIERFKGNGEFVSQFGAEGTGNGQFGELIRGLAVDKSGVIWVSDSSNHRVERFDSTGKYLSKFGTEGTGNGQFFLPSDIAIDGGGNAWIVDYGHERVEEFGPVGSYQRQFGKFGKGPGEFSNPTGIATDAANNIWVADSGTHRVSEWNSKGEYLTQFGETGAGEAQFLQPSGLAIDPQGSLLILDKDAEVQKWFVLSHDASSEFQTLPDDDPSVEVATAGGLVESVEGEEAGGVTYAHKGQMLTAVNSAAGETKYEYDAAERMTKVTLPNGTWGKIEYEALGRVKSVAVSIEGAKAKTTYFSYQDEPSRRTTVTPESEPVTTYDIGADGSVFKWQNAVKPPEIEQLTGSLYVQRGEVHPEPITIGDQTLLVQAHSPEGISSIQIVANGNQIVAEKTCAQEPEKPGTECVSEAKELVTNTEAWAPGVLQLEVIVTDRLNQVASQRFWDNIPYTPPPDTEAPDPPKFAEVLRFREEFGLDLDLKSNEFALNERIFELISLWHNPNTPEGEVARSTMERWGVPLRPIDVAELEYRQRYIEQAAALIPQWANSHAAGSYAGYYVDDRAGGIIHVGFTSNQTANVEALKASANLIEPNRVQAFDSTPSNPLSSLQSLAASVAGHMSTNTLFTSVSLDQQQNRVSVGASNVAEAQALLNGWYGAGALLYVFYRQTGNGPKNVRERLSGPLRAGDRVVNKNWECTLGFGAKKPSAAKPNGEVTYKYFALTAAHCFPLNGTAYRTGKNAKNEYEELPIGKVRSNGWTQTQNGYGTDGEAIELESAGIVPRWIQLDSHSTQRIQGVVAPHENMFVCTTGITSKRVHCGRVGGFVLEGYEGQTMYQVQINAAGPEGNSGGPVWELTTGAAVGLTSSGPTGPAEWRETNITPLLPMPEAPESSVPGILGAPGMGPLSLVGG